MKKTLLLSSKLIKNRLRVDKGVQDNTRGCGRAGQCKGVWGNAKECETTQPPPVEKDWFKYVRWVKRERTHTMHWSWQRSAMHETMQPSPVEKDWFEYYVRWVNKKKELIPCVDGDEGMLYAEKCNRRLSRKDQFEYVRLQVKKKLRPCVDVDKGVPYTEQLECDRRLSRKIGLDAQARVSRKWVWAEKRCDNESWMYAYMRTTIWK